MTGTEKSILQIPGITSGHSGFLYTCITPGSIKKNKKEDQSVNSQSRKKYEKKEKKLSELLLMKTALLITPMPASGTVKAAKLSVQMKRFLTTVPTKNAVLR